MRFVPACSSIVGQIAVLILWTTIIWLLILLSPLGLAFFEPSFSSSLLALLAVKSLPLAFAEGGILVMAFNLLQMVSTLFRLRRASADTFDSVRIVRLSLLVTVWLVLAFLLWVMVGKPQYW